MKITYRDFLAYLKQEGYSDGEAVHLFGAVKSMDRQSRAWVLRWFNKGILPDAMIEGVTASYLINNCGYKPLNAFIVLDWLKTDPQAAKYFVLKIPSTISPSETIGDEMEEYINETGGAAVDETPNPNDMISE